MKIFDHKYLSPVCVEKGCQFAGAVRDGSQMHFDATFTAFGLLSAFVSAWDEEPDPRRQLDLLHRHADIIAKELVGRGWYRYSPRAASPAPDCT